MACERASAILVTGVVSHATKRSREAAVESSKYINASWAPWPAPHALPTHCVRGGGKVAAAAARRTATYAPPGESLALSSEQRGDAVLDREALARLWADEVAVDDLDLEEHVVQRLEEALVLAAVRGQRRRQRLLHAQLRRTHAVWGCSAGIACVEGVGGGGRRFSANGNVVKLPET